MIKQAQSCFIKITFFGKNHNYQNRLPGWDIYDQGVLRKADIQQEILGFINGLDNSITALVVAAM